MPRQCCSEHKWFLTVVILYDLGLEWLEPEESNVSLQLQTQEEEVYQVTGTGM